MHSGGLAIHAITDDDGGVLEPAWLARAETVHRALRPALEPDYARQMARVFRDGARMLVAAHDGTVVGVAVYRIFENTCDRVHLYLDDLVTDEASRSSGVGSALLAHLEEIARAAGCAIFTLDSGTARHRAHKFYFREGFVVRGFHFAKMLD